ncbi:MAG: sensor histidine kinase [Afipia sp.]|nr:sensor histidine kinase [Afipia sp.]
MAPEPDAPSGIPDKATLLRKIATQLQGFIARARENYRISLFPKTDAEARLAHAQLAMVRESTKANVVIVPFIGILVGFYNHEILPWINMIGWWSVLTATCVGAEIAAARIGVTHVEVTPRNVGIRARWFTGFATAVRLAWASMIFLLWVPGDQLDHIVLVLLLSASLSSASSVSAPHYASARAAFWIYTAISLTGPIMMSGTVDYTMVGMIVLFSISMSASMRSNFETTRRMLSLQDERSGMIVNLRAAKKESDIARDRAEKASRAKSQFLANMSHELRTPMNAILGFSEMMEINTAMAHEKYSEYAGIINQSGQYLLGLINDILDLAKIESGTFQLHETRVALLPLAAECIQLLSTKAEIGGLTLVNDVPAALPDLHTDEHALRQILINLLSNALKFTPAGGEVHVFAEILRDGALAMGVRDTGVGIAAEDQKHVFENFGQGRHDIVIMDKGTGLGLPIVKGLIEAHGGRVEMQSTVGTGTCVTVIVPATRVLSQPLTKLAS